MEWELSQKLVEEEDNAGWLVAPNDEVSTDSTAGMRSALMISERLNC